MKKFKLPLVAENGMTGSSGLELKKLFKVHL